MPEPWKSDEARLQELSNQISIARVTGDHAEVQELEELYDVIYGRVVADQEQESRDRLL